MQFSFSLRLLKQYCWVDKKGRNWFWVLICVKCEWREEKTSHFLCRTFPRNFFLQVTQVKIKSLEQRLAHVMQKKQSQRNSNGDGGASVSKDDIFIGVVAAVLATLLLKLSTKKSDKNFLIPKIQPNLEPQLVLPHRRKKVKKVRFDLLVMEHSRSVGLKLCLKHPVSNINASTQKILAGTAKKSVFSNYSFFSLTTITSLASVLPSFIFCI